MARHIYLCPLRWADMDSLGHVNNVTYVDYLQESRVDMLRVHAPATGGEQLAEGTVVVRHEVEFVAPLVFRPEPVRIETLHPLAPARRWISLEEAVWRCDRVLKRPRKAQIMVKAGAPVDAVIEQLIPLLEPGDIIIDGGNSLWTDTAHDVCALWRCVSVALTPRTCDRYAGVYVYHCCASPPSEKCGVKKYGWLKSRRTPRSSDEYRACAPADRAPPRKLTW